MADSVKLIAVCILTMSTLLSLFLFLSVQFHEITDVASILSNFHYHPDVDIVEKNYKLIEFISDETGKSIQLKRKLTDDDFNFTLKFWLIPEIIKNEIIQTFTNCTDRNLINLCNAYGWTKTYLLDNPDIDINKLEINNDIFVENKDNIYNESDMNNINIIEFNAERGRTWIDVSRKLRLLQITENKRIDIIILNEMDIGMARSKNLHTTRLLAESLNMNYVFGVEFIEFTKGTKQEKKRTVGIKNRYSIHGNAILCKCIFDRNDYKLFRNKIEDIYFSNKSSWINAYGFEKRLGGRMGMFIFANLIKSKYKIPIIIGSIHKLGSKYYQNVIDYMDQHKNITNYTIVGGDQVINFCEKVNLKRLWHDDKQNTCIANCKKSYYGYRRCDILCGNRNIDVAIKEETILPCIDGVQLADHSFIHVSLKIKS